MVDCLATRMCLQACKEDGNKQYIQGNLPEAVQAYGHGISVAHSKLYASESVWGRIGRDQVVDECLDMLAIIYNNRAACYLKLGQNKEVRPSQLLQSLYLVDCTVG